MLRLLLFLGLIGGLCCLFSLILYQSPPFAPHSQHPFDYRKAQKAYIAHQAEISLATTATKQPTTATDLTESRPSAKPTVPTVALDTLALKNGQKVYQKVGKCVTCHGKFGEGRRSQKGPRIGGQYAWYTIKQLKDMKAKRRLNKVMDPYLKKLSDQDIEDVAAYLEKIPWN